MNYPRKDKNVSMNKYASSYGTSIYLKFQFKSPWNFRRIHGLFIKLC